MSRITQVLNRHLRPFVLNTVRSLNGLPVPSDSVDVMAYESDSQACRVITVSYTHLTLPTKRIV